MTRQDLQEHSGNLSDPSSPFSKPKIEPTKVPIGEIGSFFSIVVIVLLVVFLVIRGYLPSNPFTAYSTPAILSTLGTFISTESPSPTLTPAIKPLPAQFIDSKGISMVLIPAGSYSMGSNINDDEQPIHKVSLDNYYIDQFEVTNASYSTCVGAGICSVPEFRSSSTRPIYYGNQQYAKYPVINVTWNMARRYCEDWRGARLPTETEWEIAARGTTEYIFPWGNDIDCDLANFGGNGIPCVGDTTQVGNYESGKSPYGVYDMAGNVKEWVADWYDQGYYSTLSTGTQNPQGPLLGASRVIRGGSWKDNDYAQHSTNRNWRNPAEVDSTIGFRCAVSP